MAAECTILRCYNGLSIMRRPHRSVVGICIVVIGLSAVLPGISGLECALIEPQWVLLVDETPVAVDSTVEPVDEQPLPLLSFLPSRAPPSVAVA